MLMEYITSTSARESEPKPKNNARYRNNRTFWRLKPYIDKTYPPGHYIGIANEKIVADAADFDTVHEKLKLIVKRRDQGMVVQAGVDYLKAGIDL